MSQHYDFRQLGAFHCKDIAASIAPLLIEKRALNTSFDSGRIQMPSWEQINGFPFGPPITSELIADWPVSHQAFCDEWWIFESSVPRDFEVVALCNYTSTTLATYQKLDHPGICQLDSYLEKFRPLAVFGNNSFGYLIVDSERYALPEDFPL